MPRGLIVAGHFPSHWRDGQWTRPGAASMPVEDVSGHRTTKSATQAVTVGAPAQACQHRPSMSALVPISCNALQFWFDEMPLPDVLVQRLHSGCWRGATLDASVRVKAPRALCLPVNGLSLASSAADVGRVGEVDGSRIFELDLLAHTRRSGRREEVIPAAEGIDVRCPPSCRRSMPWRRRPAGIRLVLVAAKKESRGYRPSPA